MKRAPMSREKARALALRLLEGVARRDLPQVVSCYAEEAVMISPLFGDQRGRAAIEATWERLFSQFPGFSVEVQDVLVDGDRIAILTTVTTTDLVGWIGLPPTGSPIDYRLVLLLTVAGGRVIRDERIYDSRGLTERLEKVRLESELRTAAEVQRSLLSRTSHRTAFCESVGASAPCRAIGGDFFEFIELPSGEVGIAMGDVAGKGPAAALLAAMLQGMLAADAPLGGSPAALVGRLNRRLAARHLAARFATFVYAVLSPDGRLVCVNAGHNPPAIVGPDGVGRLVTGGPVLGPFADARYEEDARLLREGESLVMFTDGVTEATNADGEEFGERRLVAHLAAAAGSPPVDFLDGLFAAVHAFCRGAEQNDDITAMITRFR
jgi:phosphoserine phosphatase RsbU/P